jgi:hypothetical protein
VSFFATHTRSPIPFQPRQGSGFLRFRGKCEFFCDPNVCSYFDLTTGFQLLQVRNDTSEISFSTGNSVRIFAVKISNSFSKKRKSDNYEKARRYAILGGCHDVSDNTVVREHQLAQGRTFFL